MTKNETAALITMIDTSYPNAFSMADASAMDMLVDLWTSLFANYTSDQVLAALKQYMVNDLRGFAPKPGQLIQLIDDAEHPDELTGTAAWVLVKKAARNGIYGAEEEYRKLPAVVQRAIGGPEFLKQMALMEEESNSVMQSLFERNYRIELEREKANRKISPDIRKRLEGGDRTALPGE